MRHQIQTLQNANRHLVGESIGNMTAKELKSIENRLEKGITRIRSKKHELLFSEIEYMQKREADLQSENMFLRAKVTAETERANEQQQQAMEDEMVAAPDTGGSATELEALPPTFDTRGYYPPAPQVSMLASAAAAAPQQYPDHNHHQTALHLGYHFKVDDSGNGLL
ncbi:hypothetical protein ABZP36_027511 [Zizania latifolia]